MVLLFSEGSVRGLTENWYRRCFSCLDVGFFQGMVLLSDVIFALCYFKTVITKLQKFNQYTLIASYVFYAVPLIRDTRALIP